MPINFDFRNVVNKRGSGSEVLCSNEPHVVSEKGTFIVSLQPLNVVGYGRLTVRQSPAHTGTLLTETLTLTDVTAGSLKFYIDFSTRTVTVDPNLIGSYVYSTYSSSFTHVVEEEYTLKPADADGLCRVQLQEAPLEFPLTSTDTRKIAIISNTYGLLQETKTVSEVSTTTTKYYVEFETGRVAFNAVLTGDYIRATYYGRGSVVWAEDIKELQASIKILDTNAVDADGSNPMTGDLDMDAFSITNLGSGTVDTLTLATHNHEGGSNGAVLNGSLAVLTNTIISANLNNKTISGIGAVATGNIQNAAITNTELLSDKVSLTNVSGSVLVIGGVGSETIGINTTPSISETANLLFRTQVSTSSDKFIFHDNGAGNACGMNIDASGNLNVFCLLNKKIYFKHEDYTGTLNVTVDSQTGSFTVRSDINAAAGKLKENSIPLISAGTTMVFFQATAPAGWSLLSPALSDFPLRIVSGSTGGTYTIPGDCMVFSTVLNEHKHDVGHTHVFTGSVARISSGIIQYASGGSNDMANRWHYHTSWSATSYSNGAINAPEVTCKYMDFIICSKN
ncbi:MAG: hypothetical protein WC415_06490 [Patescibacteria group bacterium]|jgi:hypothetical protein